MKRHSLCHYGTQSTQSLSLWYTDRHAKIRNNGSKGKETPKPAWGNQEDFIEEVMLKLRTKD